MSAARRRLLSARRRLRVRRGSGSTLATVSSFFRVYRASVLRAASANYGDHLIQERGFACKAELLAKLAAMERASTRSPVDLDASRRVGESKMPVLRTMRRGYWRLFVPAARSAGVRRA